MHYLRVRWVRQWEGLRGLPHEQAGRKGICRYCHSGRISTLSDQFKEWLAFGISEFLKVLITYYTYLVSEGQV